MTPQSANLPVEAHDTEVIELQSDNTEQFVTFYFGQHYFGLPIDDVIEINKALDITPVPLAPAYVAGVVNLRGQILTAVHLAQKVGMSVNLSNGTKTDDMQPDGDEAEDRAMPDTPKFNNVIMGNREEPVSLLVERIGDVMSVPVNRIEPPPAIIEGVDARYVSKVCKLKGELLIILDSKAMEQPENSNERQA